jgi:succinate dehydrogenase / fumarate reductase iron-sulfur subunit
MNRTERLEGIMQEDGITNCGNAQNCVKGLPDEHPADPRDL